MEIKYRKLVHTDLSTYRQTRLNCLLENPDNFGSTYEEEVEKDKLKFDHFLTKNDRNNFIFGAFKNELCIGICGFIRETAKRKKHRGTLVQIYVQKEYHGLGIGKQLIASTIKEAHNKLNIEQVILGVLTKNTQAIRAYQKLGFQEFALYKDFLKVGENYIDQIMMIKYLNE